MSKAIEVAGVSKNFGSLAALKDVDLTAQQSKVTGLLGPNGAGKSTLIKVMTTLLEPDAGRVTVDGVNVLKDPAETRKRIGLAGQFAAVDEFLSGRETLEMVARLYGFSRNDSKQHATRILKRLGLEDAADRQIKTYSGGMRRRIDLGASLVATPKVLFLDEPTTGLDPRTRLELWEVIRELIAQGTTILLTTQYLEEADALCDQIYVIDKGTMIVNGTADELKRSLGQDVIELKVASENIAGAQELLHKNMKRDIEKDDLTRELRLRTKDGANDIVKVAQLLKTHKIKAEELSLHKPSLDDVFLSITGERTES